MKLNCGPTEAERVEAQRQWHRWFAWHPVRLSDGTGCRWLEAVDRRVTPCRNPFGWEWLEFEYRSRTNANG